ncbi:MAG: F0F1 ATP synthase subunit epsilon [Ruminococcaceae bacterium]|nr:F0F1 ATP synthase subunit epsilon [Oscillospiraceae bacterium]
MKTFPLRISAPDGDLFRGEAVKISLRGAEGDLAVMAGHIPFITAVKPCDVKVEIENSEEKIGHTDGGILTVSSESVTMLSGSFKWV